MAVLRQQRTFIGDLYERGGVDEEEREALLGAVGAAMRQLDMTGPSWRPPAPHQVLRSLDIFAAAPTELTDALLQHARLTGEDAPRGRLPALLPLTCCLLLPPARRVQSQA